MLTLKLQRILLESGRAFPAQDSISNHTMHYRLGTNSFRYVRAYLFPSHPLENTVHKGRNKQTNNMCYFWFWSDKREM